MPEPDQLLAMLIFSIVGFIAFKQGRRELQIPKIVIGLLLMLYPYFVPAGWWVWGAGAVLTGLLFWFRE